MDFSQRKNCKEILKISGEWTDHLNFGEKNYWKIKEYSRFNLFRENFILPSDSSFRKDLGKLIKNDEKNSQILKEELDEIQRNDRKLREKFTNK